MRGWRNSCAPFLEADGCNPAARARSGRVASLLKERVNTVAELADAAVYFYRLLEPSAELKAQHFTVEAKPALFDLRQKLAVIEWESHAIQTRSRLRHGTWAQAAQSGHAAAGDGDRRSADAVDQCSAGTARPGGNPQAHG